MPLNEAAMLLYGSLTGTCFLTDAVASGSGHAQTAGALARAAPLPAQRALAQRARWAHG